MRACPVVVGLGFVDHGEPPPAGPHPERGMRDRLARVGIGHAHVDDLGRHQRRRHRLRFRDASSVLTSIALVGEPRVMDDQGRMQILAHAAHGEAALGIGRRSAGAMPGSRGRLVDQ